MAAAVPSTNESQEFTSAPPHALLVAAVHEDRVTALGAKRIMERVMGALGQELLIEQFICDFPSLSQPEGRSMMARKARSADIVVVSAYADSTALAVLTEWLEHWLAPRRESAAALVAVSVHRPASSPEGEAMEDRLAAVALRTGMDFFSTSILSDA